MPGLRPLFFSGLELGPASECRCDLTQFCTIIFLTEADLQVKFTSQHPNGPLELDLGSTVLILATATRSPQTELENLAQFSRKSIAQLRF